MESLVARHCPSFTRVVTARLLDAGRGSGFSACGAQQGIAMCQMLMCRCL